VHHVGRLPRIITRCTLSGSRVFLCGRPDRWTGGQTWQS